MASRGATFEKAHVRLTSFFAATSAITAIGFAVLSACSAPAPLGEEPDYGNGMPPVPKRDASADAKGSNLNSADASTGDAAECHPSAPNYRCSLVEQCGCAANETCDITDFKTLVNSCVTAGSLAVGRKCDATSQCQPGLACIFGSCRPFCDKAGSDCTTPGLGVCVESFGADGKPIPNSNACTIDCDPMRPEAVCGAGATCLWFPTEYAPMKVSDCDQPGTKNALDVCTDNYDCKAGLACGTHPKYGKECEQWCRLSSGGQTFNDCKAGFTCKDVFGANAPTVNGVKEGLCQD